MDWLRRIGREVPAPAPEPPEEPAQQPGVERSSPGLAAFFDGVAEDRSHAVLDLGSASDSSLRLFSRFARWVRFADLGTQPTDPGAWPGTLAAIPPNSKRPYDLVFAWDIFDRLEPGQRPDLVQHLVEITDPAARLFLTVTSAGRGPIQPMRFAVLDTDRMRFQAIGNPAPVIAPLLPGEVERMLAPFHVVRAFTSRVGLREYVAVRRKGGS